MLARLARLTLLARRPMIGSVSGIHRSATRGASVEFAEYRKYVPGDDTRHLDWRVLARTDRFYMKEFEADTNLRCHLVLDASASMGFAGAAGGRRLDRGKQLAAALAHLLLRQGDAVGLLCCADRALRDLPPRDTPSHLKIILDLLAGLEPGGRTGLVQVIHELAERIRQRALVIVISDCLTEPAPLLDAFEHLRFRRHDLAVFHLLDRQEVDFDFDRPIRFLDLESSFALVTDPVAIRAEYRAAAERHLETIRSGCRERQTEYHRVFADEDLEAALAVFLLQRLRQHSGRAR